MKRLVILFFMFPIFCSAQQIYSSPITTKLLPAEAEYIKVDRKIKIYDNEIEISNFLQENKPLIVDVYDIKRNVEDYIIHSKSDWYYCRSKEKDIYTDDYIYYIILVEKGYTFTITMYQKLSEVKYIETVFNIKN
jgi:hypothetical protein